MVNLIAGKKIVPEFLQTAMKPKLIAGSVLNLFNRSGERKNMLLQFEAVRRSLGLPGVYDRAAEAVLNKHF
jgi:lipid-A-disaccharide synthase